MTPLVPSQAAREAAALLHVEMGGTATGADMIRNGEADSALVAQAFARFEQCIRQDELERCAKVADQWPASKIAYDIATAIRKGTPA